MTELPSGFGGAQIGGQTGGGLSSESNTMWLRTLEESWATTADPIVSVARTNVRVTRIRFILIFLIPAVPEL
jgi:hypothetical protein